MNKQRFLTELKRLLVFMTDGDRDLTIQQYSEMFDEAGEEETLKKLGSPTKLAIQLSRGYVPGQVITEHKQRLALREAEKAAKTVKSRLSGVDDYTPGTQYDGDENDPVNIIMRSLEQDFTAEPEPEEEEPSRDELVTAPDWAREPDEAPAPKTVYKRLHRPMPVALGALLLTLILIAFGLPLAVLSLAAVAVLLVPGAAGFVCAGLSFIAALWCISQLADALLLFGLAFLLLGLALILFWLGVRVDVHIVRLYVRGVAALCDLLLGKKVAVE